MKTLDEVLEMLEARIDRATLEEYIARQWLRPVSSEAGWHFEDIDITRLELICHLTQDIEVNDAGMDVVLSLLDQLYGIRAHMQKLTQAIAQQQPEVQTEIMLFIKQSAKTDESSPDAK